MTTVPAHVTMDTALVRITDGRSLSGRMPVQGSKNIALHLYAAALLADVPVALTGAPDITDSGVCAQILRHTGARAGYDDGCFTVSPADVICPAIHPELGRRVRTTAVLAAAVLARTGQVAFPYPGGDAFCPRLIDRHIAAVQAAGAEVVTDDTGIRARCGARGVRAFTVDVSTPYGPSRLAARQPCPPGADRTGSGPRAVLDPRRRRTRRVPPRIHRHQPLPRPGDRPLPRDLYQRHLRRQRPHQDRPAAGTRTQDDLRHLTTEAPHG
ncbi:hypothetical protein KMT30_25950 [Streptomyces sp. IBSBF 2953]|nr:hypothetical protein [Streptomyces hayashii]